MVEYHFNVNCILDIPIRNRKGITITEGQKKIHNDFKKVEVVPSTYLLDNKILKDLIQGFEEENITYMLVTFYNHHSN